MNKPKWKYGIGMWWKEFDDPPLSLRVWLPDDWSTINRYPWRYQIINRKYSDAPIVGELAFDVARTKHAAKCEASRRARSLLDRIEKGGE